MVRLDSVSWKSSNSRTLLPVIPRFNLVRHGMRLLSAIKQRTDEYGETPQIKNTKMSESAALRTPDWTPPTTARYKQSGNFSVKLDTFIISKEDIMFIYIFIYYYQIKEH